MNYSKERISIVQLLDDLFPDSSLFATSKPALPCLPRIFDAIRPKYATVFLYSIVSCTNNNEAYTLQSNFSVWNVRSIIFFTLLIYKLKQRKIHSLAQFSFIKDTIRYDTIRYDTIRYYIHITVEVLAINSKECCKAFGLIDTYQHLNSRQGQNSNNELLKPGRYIDIYRSTPVHCILHRFY